MADYHGMPLGNPEAYIGRKPCGCVVGMAVNVQLPDCVEDLAEALAQWVKWGASIEPHTLESSRRPENAPYGCSHD